MFDFVSAWYKRYFTDPQAALLVVLLLVSTLTIYFMGKMLTPLIAAVIIAYLLEGPVTKLQPPFSRLIAVIVVFCLFLLFMVFLVLFLLPILSRQASQFFLEVPNMINRGQDLMLRLPQEYPQIISESSIKDIIFSLSGELSAVGQTVLSFSFASIPLIVIYLVLVPLMIFFFMKDKITILEWMSRFLPADRQLVTHLWVEMDGQIGNYIRGKVYEIITVGVVAYIVFIFFGLNYASLLAIIVGLSVLIPYIGAATVTIPVALVGFFQWGLGSDFTWLMIAYFVLQFLDGNVLVPVLFSDAVNIHAVAIIAAILIFGGLWGFWGVFFAIPLATLVKALINVWPMRSEEVAQT
jgi:putative permease